MLRPQGLWPIAHGLLLLLASAQASALSPIQAIRANYAAINAQIAAKTYRSQSKDGTVCGDISSQYTRWTDTRSVTRKLSATFYNDSSVVMSKQQFEVWFDAHEQPNFVLYSQRRVQEPDFQVRFYMQRGQLIRVLQPSNLNKDDQQEIWRSAQYLIGNNWQKLGGGC